MLKDQAHDGTTHFNMKLDKDSEVQEIMGTVLKALEFKGYNAVNQLVGYFLSGDPTYITNHEGARAVIRRMERDEILEVILRDYLDKLKQKD